jgi:predicted nucleotidyltransferase
MNDVDPVEGLKVVARRAAERLANVDGVAAVAMGGSLARGEADAHSDVDLGVYYHRDRPLDVEALRALARELDDRHPPDAVTDIGGWGPWINGGGWLLIDGLRVDWLYRDLTLVASTLADCEAGRYASHYQPGHPHAFHTHMLMGEVFHGAALVDRDGAFGALKQRAAIYPPALRRAVMAGVWEAGFSLEAAAKPIARNDVFHVTGCLFRSAVCMVQALFARNDRYFVNEKRALDAIEGFASRPEGFRATVREVLAAPGTSPDTLARSAARLQDLAAAVVGLCNQARSTPN